MARSRTLLALVLVSPIAAAASGDGKPLVWGDLVNRAELWPPAVKIAKAIQFRRARRSPPGRSCT